MLVDLSLKPKMLVELCTQKNQCKSENANDWSFNDPIFVPGLLGGSSH